MNKYVLRTSLVWLTVIAVLVGFWAYRSGWLKPPANRPTSGDVQPVAAGPSAEMKERASTAPEEKMEARTDAEHRGHDRDGGVQAIER
jgi:Cu(I)/Ag(I) efflux system membrane fusion protein/cobalt-zinc-cadmium efflux system membrane fusion protein